MDVYFQNLIPQDIAQNEAMLQPLLEGVSKLGPYIQVYAPKNSRILRIESVGSTGFCGDGKGPSPKIVRI